MNTNLSVVVAYSRCKEPNENKNITLPVEEAMPNLVKKFGTLKGMPGYEKLPAICATLSQFKAFFDSTPALTDVELAAYECLKMAYPQVGEPDDELARRVADCILCISVADWHNKFSVCASGSNGFFESYDTILQFESMSTAVSAAKQLTKLVRANAMLCPFDHKPYDRLDVCIARNRLGFIDPVRCEFVAD